MEAIVNLRMDDIELREGYLRAIDEEMVEADDEVGFVCIRVVEMVVVIEKMERLQILPIVEQLVMVNDIPLGILENQQELSTLRDEVLETVVLLVPLMDIEMEETGEEPFPLREPVE